MVMKKTTIRGVFTVHRTDDEKPFAELHSPTSRGARIWGIKYRGRNADCPFDPNVFNSSAKNSEEAIYELERTMKICSEFQLCLKETP